MANTQLALTPQELHFFRCIYSKLMALDMGDQAVITQLREVELLTDSLELLVSQRRAMSVLLDDEPDSAVH